MVSVVDLSNSLLQNQILIRVTTALVILLIGIVIGRIAGKSINKLLREIEFDKTVKKATGVDMRLSVGISDWASYLIYFFAVMISLETIGLTPVVLNILFGVLLVVIAITIVLAIKDYVPNFIAGFTVRNGKYQVGDKIKLDHIQGKIEKFTLFETHIRHKKDLIVIPNNYFVKNPVIKLE